MARLQQCPCGSGEFPEALHDGHNIFMCYVCDKCRSAKVSKFRPDIFEPYECDEPIDDGDGLLIDETEGPDEFPA